ncbi:MAG: T9SS type A sorting domain-containing protein [candidate division WOR-3 bacterium]
MKQALAAIFVLATSMAVADPLNGTYTIKKDGSGDFYSFTDAASALVTRGLSGDVVFEAYDGIYDDGVVDMRYANTAGKTVTFRPAVGQSVTVCAPGAGFIFWASGDLAPTHYIKIQGLTLKDCAGWAVCAPRCHFWTVSNCRIQTDRGIMFGGSFDSVLNCDIQVTGTTSSIGIYFAGSSGFAANNFVSGATGMGVYTLNASGTKLHCNTLITDSASVNAIGIYENGSRSTLRGNVIVGSLVAYSGGSFPASSNYNCWYKHDGSENLFYVSNIRYLTMESWRSRSHLDTNSFRADPLVVDKWTDLHLQASSPCIGSSAPIAGILTDFDGEPRDAQPDIGADEYYPVGLVDDTSFQISECRLQIEPNPACRYVRVSLTGQASSTCQTELRLHDASGRCVLVRPLDHSTTGPLVLDLCELSSGVYFVRVPAGSCSVTEKLVVR